MKLVWGLLGSGIRSAPKWRVLTNDRLDILDSRRTPAWVWAFWRRVNGWGEK